MIPRADRSLLILLLAGWSTTLTPGIARAVWPNDPTENVPLCTASGARESRYAIISDGEGGAIIAWCDNRNGNIDVWTQRVSAAGEPLWHEDGLAICTAAGSQTLPKIVSDGAGGGIITWTDDRGLDNYNDIYAQRVSAAGVPLWTSNGVAVCTAIKWQIFPSIISDGEGGAFIAWEDNRIGSGGNTDIYAQRLSADGVPQWTADGVPLCTAQGQQFSPTLVSDGAEGAIATWWQASVPNDPGATWSIYGQRVSAAGMPQWTANGVELSAPATARDPTAIVPDGAGGAIVAWAFDCRSDTNGDIYAQRVDVAGVLQWTTGGVPVSTAPGPQFWPGIVSNGAGGAIVTWNDVRVADSYRVYAQQVSAAGIPQWTTDGVSLSTADTLVYPTIVSDDEGGAIVSWAYGRSFTDSDIYAQRVSAAGVPLWSAIGVAVSTAGNEQGDPINVSDGAGGVIVAWLDRRNVITRRDIYAQRVEHFGNLGNPAVDVPVVDLPASLRLAAIEPNPMRGAARIAFDVPRPSGLRLVIYDASGRSVRELFRGSHEAGRFALPWDLRDDGGRAVSAGVYFVRLETARYSLTRRIVTLQ